jgi:hypothetical protein
VRKHDRRTFFVVLDEHTLVLYRENQKTLEINGHLRSVGAANLAVAWDTKYEYDSTIVLRTCLEGSASQ